ncbi:MAG: glycosyl hydrolase [Acidobacteria bacterium]|nr:glycosyl hydrolase [Acidobacteriota bacterium]
MIWWFAMSLWVQVPEQTTMPTSADTRLQAYEARRAMESQSMVQDIELVQVGPTEMGGRVVDIVCFADRPQQIWAAYASGGLWRSDNMGSSWTPLFDTVPSITIGDIAIHPEHRDTIYVGTGEKNSSRSSYAGTGIYRSDDGGKNWRNLGLSDTHHISRVLIHPDQPDVIFVAAIGHLYSRNEQRGVFRSQDGGTSWEKVLYINDETGVIDLAMDPNNHDHLLAAAWDRSRTAWNFEEGGPETGVYRSDDGGNTWTKSNEGLPLDHVSGRIGIAFAPTRQGRVYLTLDNQATRAEPRFNPTPITRAKLKDMSIDTLLAFDDKELESFLRGNDFHADVTAESVRKGLKDGELTIQDLLDYMFDGNQALFDREVIGVEVYRSDDTGRTWEKTHEPIIEDFAYSYGYYFGEVAVDPTDAETIYITGVPLLKSEDGGKTFTNINEPYVHVDHHVVWINPTNPDHLINGNDGGVDLSFDGGESWHELGRVPAGQFYTVAYDQAPSYRIYGGLQDNGVWQGYPERLTPASSPWESIGGGDGAFIEVDPRDNQTVYLGYQFGHYQRKTLGGGDRITIYPRHKLKEKPYRFNWMTPIELSHHHSDILYMGCQYVLRSMDRGKTWTEISPDLTTSPEQGDVPYGTMTVLRESTKTFGTLYAGTDDGKVWTTQGSSMNWRDISAGLPAGLWVSGLEISPFGDETVYITLTGYRNDDFATYVYKSHDGGKTWINLKSNLPEEACNVIREDPKKQGHLYLGTDVGLWVSLNGGESWQPMTGGLPQVPVYALEIHKSEPDLIVATHGRSIFVADISGLRQIKPSMDERQLMTIDDVDFSSSWGSTNGTWWGKYSEEPHTKITFFLPKAQDATITASIEGSEVFKHASKFSAGLNHVRWNYQLPELKPKQLKKLTVSQGGNTHWYVKQGEVKVTLKTEGFEAEQTFKIKHDED